MPLVVLDFAVVLTLQRCETDRLLAVRAPNRPPPPQL